MASTQQGDGAAPARPDLIRATSTFVENQNKLAEFRELVGITRSDEIEHPSPYIDGSSALDEHAAGPPDQTRNSPVKSMKRPSRPSGRLCFGLITLATENDGYYRRSINEEYKASIGYHFSSILINSIIIIQIFIAATITALAAYSGHKITLTVLGAINTALAGMLAFMKGMGLPNRMIKSRDQFRYVREYADDVERQMQFARTKTDLDPWKESETVRKLFEAARKDQQDNYPDRYTNKNEQAQRADMKVEAAARERKRKNAAEAKENVRNPRPHDKQGLVVHEEEKRESGMTDDTRHESDESERLGFALKLNLAEDHITG